MARIHPTSIVDPSAVLADDVQVGPHCVITGPVVVGAGTRLVGNVYLDGNTHIGQRNLLYPFTCIGFPPQDRKYDPARLGPGVRIGDDNLFRESVTVHRATGEHPTAIGHRNFIMVNAHLAHDVVLGNDCTLANAVLLAGHVHVADRVNFGGGAQIHQFVRIGRMAMVGGGIGIVQDIPPFATAYHDRALGSLNLVGLRRAGLRPHIDNLRKAFDIACRDRHTRQNAVELIRRRFSHDPLCAEFADFIAASKRGITRLTERLRTSGDDSEE